MVDDVLAALRELGEGDWTESKIREKVQKVRGATGRADRTATRTALAILAGRGDVELRPGNKLPSYRLVGWSPPKGRATNHRGDRGNQAEKEACPPGVKGTG
jgi:hypothetical protein